VLQHVENPVCSESFASKVEAVQSRLEGFLLNTAVQVSKEDDGTPRGRKFEGCMTSWAMPVEYIVEMANTIAMEPNLGAPAQSPLFSSYFLPSSVGEDFYGSATNLLRDLQTIRRGGEQTRAFQKATAWQSEKKDQPMRL